ncbi:MAG: Ig-like domain-containing protein [Gammaproteobacteria bacterium]|nr:Ig-like domain-containing protein [Gammaproteobacteria bacterium]
MNNQMAVFSFFSEKKDFKRMTNPVAGWSALFLFSFLCIVSTNTLASSDITNTQPAAYQWDVLDVGSEVYIDRDFTYVVVPSRFQNLPYLRTANEDKSATDKAVSFEVSDAVTVYVAYDDRNEEIPAWLQSWTRTETVLLSSDVSANLRLYTNDYMAGTVTLGSNQADKNSMYTVIVRAKNRRPEVVSISANTDAKEIEVAFSEVVTADSAENPLNYSITPDISVSSAQLSADGTMVTLTTGELGEGVYTLTVNNVEDETANIIASDNQTDFTYTSALVIDKVQQGTYEQGILTVDNKVYIDRDFIYTAIPERFRYLKYLRTANNDKMGAAEDFLSFDVNQAVTVYVAYDERYPQQPEWLQSWVKTEDALKTTDVESNPAGVSLALYRKEYEAGTIILGGNEAEHEEDNSMYTVIVSAQKEDTLPPKVIAVSADSGNNTEVKVEFSEVITVESAENPSNYNIAPEISVLTAELEIKDTIFVKLTTDALTEGVTYTLTVNNIEDTTANTIMANSQADFTLKMGNNGDTGGSSDDDTGGSSNDDTGGGVNTPDDTGGASTNPDNGADGGGGGGAMSWLGMLLLAFGVLKVGSGRNRKLRQ